MTHTTCVKYGKEFKYVVADMNVPGGKDREYISCPYCGEINGSSVTSGFIYSHKIEDKTFRVISGDNTNRNYFFGQRSRTAWF